MKTAKNQKFLALYGSYQELIVGLFDGGTCVAHLYAENQRLSSYLLVAVQEVLQKAGWSIADLDFIAVDQGPGSFNSLRAMLATVNGIAYASGIPLVGCDGLLTLADALMVEEGVGNAERLHVALLNAYNSELYYRIEHISPHSVRTLISPPGYATFEEVAVRIKQAALDNARRVYSGNGYSFLVQYAPELQGAYVGFDSAALLSAFARQAQERNVAGGVATSLQALYLKAPSYKKVS